MPHFSSLFLCPAIAFAFLLPSWHAKALSNPNVLLICVDDLRPELRSFGADYVSSPNIDRLAGEGRPFHRHYVQAPTCGASRYTLLTGKYGPYTNAALFSRSQKIEYPSFPGWFRKHGYATVSVGKVSHHPGGRGGPDWDDGSKLEMPESWDRHILPAGPWRHPRGAMHGLANGEIRKNAKDMDVLQSVTGNDKTYPDGLIYEESISQLDSLEKNGKPFFLAVGFIRPHLPFGAPAKYMKPYEKTVLPAIPHPAKPQGKSTWHGSGEFMKYNRWKRNPNTDSAFADMVRKNYAACVTYVDALVGQLLGELEKRKLRDNTIIILWGDHGWHLGEHAIWGKHALYEESLRSPLIISYPGIPKPGKPTHSIVETLDVFPTICELAGLEIPPYAEGQSLTTILKNPKIEGRPALSYGKKGTFTIRTKSHRLITHQDGTYELYDHRSPLGETKNIARQEPGLVNELSQKLNARLNAK